MPNIYKIGFTDRSPLQRAEELSNSTSVPTDFNIVFYIECEEPSSVEREIHEELDQYRLNRKREFFGVGLNILLTKIWPLFQQYAQNEVKTYIFDDLENEYQKLKKEQLKIVDKS